VSTSGGRAVGIIILLLILAYTVIQHASIVYGSEAYPLSIGYGSDGRYVLYSDNTVYRITPSGGLGYLARLPAPLNLSEYTMHGFTVADGYVAVYMYKALNGSSGYTRILVVNATGGVAFDESFSFTIVNGAWVQGSLVLAAAFTSRGLAVLLSNSTSQYIYVYEKEADSLALTRIYKGSYSATLYVRNGSILAVVPFTSQLGNTTAVVPTLIDVFTNTTLFQIPSLIPVIPFATPIIQVFTNGSDWLVHATVANTLANRIEYYFTSPGSYELRDSLRASFSPLMDCGVIEAEEGSIVLFSDGVKYFLNQYIPVLPRGVFSTIDPPNGILDADPLNHRALVKYTTGNTTKIYLLQDNELTKIYELPAEHSYTSSGFYAALVGDYVFLVDLGSHTLVKINLTDMQGGEKEIDVGMSGLHLELLLLLTVSLIIVVLIIVFLKKLFTR